MALDRTLQKIVDRIAEEEGIPSKTVEKVIRHSCDWTREQFIELNYPSVRWPKFGTFTLRRGKIQDPEQLEAYDKFRCKTSDKYKNYLEYIKTNKNGNEKSAPKGEPTQCSKSDKQCGHEQPNKSKEHSKRESSEETRGDR